MEAGVFWLEVYSAIVSIETAENYSMTETEELTNSLLI